MTCHHRLFLVVLVLVPLLCFYVYHFVDVKKEKHHKKFGRFRDSEDLKLV
jgi:hypothetical protein